VTYSLFAAAASKVRKAFNGGSFLDIAALCVFSLDDAALQAQINAIYRLI
jgi:hypothetical protein